MAQQSSYLTSLRILFLAFLMSQVSFGVFLIAFHQMGLSEVSAPELRGAFQIVVPLFAVIALFGSQYIFNQKLRNIHKESALEQKLAAYRMAFLIKIALLEGASLLSLVVYFLTAYWLFLVIAGVLGGVFILYYPSVERIGQHLELLPAEKEQIT